MKSNFPFLKVSNLRAMLLTDSGSPTPNKVLIPVFRMFFKYKWLTIPQCLNMVTFMLKLDVFDGEIYEWKNYLYHAVPMTLSYKDHEQDKNLVNISTGII